MAGFLKRGDVAWADLDPVTGHEQAGRRPVLIISDNLINRHSGTVIAMPLTSQPQKAPFPLTYLLPELISKKKSWVKISQIRTLSTKRLHTVIGHVDETQINIIIDGLNEILGA